MTIEVPLTPLQDWPAERLDPPRPTSAMTGWARGTRHQLGLEIAKIDHAEAAELEVDADDRDILRSRVNLVQGRYARTGRVRLTVYRTGERDPLTFCGANLFPKGTMFANGHRGWPCAPWELSARAILLTLQSLRALDRYGVVEGDAQYAGFAPLALTTGARALPPAPAEGTPGWALARLAERAQVHTGLESGEIVRRARAVAKRDGWLDEWNRLAAIFDGREAGP